MTEQGKALVTGGSRGLGRSIAVKLAGAGFTVAVAYRSDERAALETVGLCGDGAFAIRADLSTREGVALMAQAVKDRMGGLDAIVLNAGVAHDNLLVKATEEEWALTLDTNLKGAYLATKALAPMMASGGHIVMVVSRSGLRGNKGQAAYSASKAALHGLSLSLARELGPLGIRVNMLVPGYMPTAMGNANQQAMNAALKGSLLGTLGSSEEAASFVAWLVTTKTITGQSFVIDSRI